MTARHKILLIVAGLGAGYFAVLCGGHRGRYEIIHNFDGRDDGVYPGPLTPARDGAVYGVTWNGGPNGLGAIFKISNDSNYRILHAFDPPVENDEVPALVQGKDGRLYGKTGRPPILYSVTTNGSFMPIHRFGNGPDGAGFHYVSRGLLLASDGSLYDTSAGPEPSPTVTNCGAVFRITPDGDFELIHTFTGREDGANPGGLVLAADGTVYGVSVKFSPYNTYYAVRGYPDDFSDPMNVFRIGTNGTFTLVRTFPGLVFLQKSSLGTAYAITTNQLFRIGSDGAFTMLHEFDPPREGSKPSCPELGNDGNLYGFAAAGGKFNAGTFFRISPDRVLTVLHSFKPDTDGACPFPIGAGLGDYFYGFTFEGGAHGEKTVFRITRDGSLRRLYSFTGVTGHTFTERGSDGNIYIATSDGGRRDAGVLLRINQGGSLSVLHTFGGAGDGAHPECLVSAGDGNLYGTTLNGGAGCECGTVFRVRLRR